jgi:hypothetical protein
MGQGDDFQAATTSMLASTRSQCLPGSVISLPPPAGTTGIGRRGRTVRRFARVRSNRRTASRRAQPAHPAPTDGEAGWRTNDLRNETSSCSLPSIRRCSVATCARWNQDRMERSRLERLSRREITNNATTRLWTTRASRQSLLDGVASRARLPHCSARRGLTACQADPKTGARAHQARDTLSWERYH